MSLFTWSNELVKKLSWIDVKLTAWGGIFIGLLLARWIPWLSEVNVWYLIVLGGLCLIKVYYVLFFK